MFTDGCLKNPGMESETMRFRNNHNAMGIELTIAKSVEHFTLFQSDILELQKIIMHIPLKITVIPAYRCIEARAAVDIVRIRYLGAFVAK